jgi:hypothetical protein
MNATGVKAAIKNNAIVAVVAIGGGFVGSMIHDAFKTGPSTIRAERFEVVGAGRPLSYWGRTVILRFPPRRQREA